MKKNEIAGSTKVADSAAKEATGEVTDHAKLQQVGRDDEPEGNIRNAIEDIKDAVRHSL